MKPLYLFLASLAPLYYPNLLSQNITPSVIALAGDHQRLPGGSQITWTIGEPVIDPVRSESLLLTQGFHQPELRIITGFIDPDFAFPISIFPSPTNGLLMLKTTYPDKLKYYLSDIFGRTFSQGTLVGEQILEVGELNAGTYCIYFSTDGRLVRSELIVKK
ncbi:MAG: T9SS type A sorting domain-containing protein [Saprospiraceae bacterium]|nr:T9SS type A sorting domain-containing protein [Saprospiraceae bacterium]